MIKNKCLRTRGLQKDKKMTIDICGDITLANWDGLEACGSDAAEYINGLIGKVDLRIANLESPILDDGEYTRIIKTGPSLSMNLRQASFIKYIDIDTFAMANNHIGDYGIRGIQSTISYLEEIGKGYFGIEEDGKETYVPYTVKDKGIVVSFFSVCENEFGTSEVMGVGADGYNLKKLADSLKQEKELNHLSIVIFHGGAENYPFPSVRQRERYRLMIDIGADAVINMHQHCPVGMELYRDRFIFYGTGNFIFPRMHSALFDSAWNYGYIVRFEINGDGKIDADYIPYRFDDTLFFEKLDKDRFEKYMNIISEPISDGRIKEYYDAWSLMMGDILYHRLEKTMLEEDDIKRLLIKNIFSCESHFELMNNYMRLCYTNRLKQKNMNFDILREAINMENYIDYPTPRYRTIIWGITEKGIKIFEKLKKMTSNPNADIVFVDRDERKQGFRIGGCLITDPQNVIGKYASEYYICTPSRYVSGIRHELLDRGTQEEMIHEC